MLQEKRLNQIDYVIRNAKYVKLNKQKLDEWSDNIKNNISYEHHWKQYKNEFSEEEIIILAFFIESMNFCFWKEPIFRYKDTKKSEAMCKLFIEAVLNNKKLLDINYLINLTYDKLKDIFKMEEGNLKNRYNSLMYTVKKINNTKDFFENLFNIKTTDDLYKYITSFENFNDISTYKGKEIYFYKRATLLINDFFELSDTIRNNIKNIDSVLGCADYIIPKGLRKEGIFEYDELLSKMIDNNIEILPNSEYEVEIRAFTLYVIEYVKNKKDKNVNSARWDNIIWNSFRGKGGISHRVDTIFY